MVTTNKPKALSEDPLPERVPYRDDGCSVSPRCLDCPLPQCKYDDPVSYQEELRRQRDNRVLEAYWRCSNVAQAAAQAGVSPRTVHRILTRSQVRLLNGGPPPPLALAADA